MRDFIPNVTRDEIKQFPALRLIHDYEDNCIKWSYYWLIKTTQTRLYIYIKF